MGSIVARVARVALAVLAVAPMPCFAAEYRVLPGASDFVVVTHKGGLASGLAHDHVIAAGAYDAALDFDPAAQTSTRFTLELSVEDLVVDDPNIQERAYPRLEQLGVLDSPLSAVSDKDRGKIRKSMLGKSQLDATSFPKIRVTAVGVEEVRNDDDAGEFTHEVRVTLEVRGRSVERAARARYTVLDGGIEAEALAEFRFTDFEIKPYSAMLGAVRNKDRFHLYMRLTAKSSSE